jgi:hypothetical protein
MARMLVFWSVALLSLPWPAASGADNSPPAAVQAAVGSALTPPQRDILLRAHRHEKHGWIYLHVEGAPADRGFQHGYLLAPEIQDSLSATRHVWRYESGMEWPWLVDKARSMWQGKIDAENLAELDGVAAGLQAAGVASSRDELIAYNGIIELAAYWWPKEKEKSAQSGVNRVRESCSAFVATGSATVGGGIVMGHNTMGGYADNDCNIILDIVPASGHRILMQGYPGWIHSGTDFFITDAGLMGTETTIGGFKGFDENGVPEFARMRRATQDAASIDDWCQIMRRGNNGGYANAWLLGDIRTREIARLELGLQHVAFEKKKDGVFVGSNVAEDVKILRLETSVDETDIRLSSVARRVRWKQLMRRHAGQIDLELAKQLEADHYDVFRQAEYPGERSLCSHGDLEREPAGRRVPFEPSGTVDAKVVDAAMAREMSFAARWGSACGTAFRAREFLEAHPQFDWMEGILKDRPAQPWTVFRAGEQE